MQFSTSQDYKLADAFPSPPLNAELKPLEGLIIAIK